MKYLASILVGLLLAASPAALAEETAEPTGVVTLLCKMPRNSEVLTQTLSIDYDRKLINGISAEFSPSTITWTVSNGSKSEHYELNRVTGSYNFWGDNETSSGPMPAFTCVVAPKKF